MLDIRLIRDNPQFVKDRLVSRGGEDHLKIDEILECDKQRRATETQLQQIQADRKRISKEIGAKKAKGEDTSEIEAQVRGFGDEMARLNAQATDLDNQTRDLLLKIPNLPHDNAPAGTSAEDNPEVKVWGQKPVFDFQPLDHLSIAEKLGLLDMERATKISGSGFACFVGAGAKLERALINFMLDLHTTQHGYKEVAPPLLIKPDALVGTSQLPKFEEQLYRAERDDLYLLPTAEVPVTNLHREELLPNAQLPKKLVSYTPCFRREAGAAGLGTRGMIRIHQFDKVELVKITTPETSFQELDLLTADAEKVLQLLGLHYRIIELCTGDIGFGSTKTYDIEVWAPGQNAYLEVSSCSNFGEFQARRMNLRFKDAEGKNRFCHTLNGSGVACPRLFVALLETYQQADGTIKLPEAIQPYFGAAVIG